MGRIVPAEGPKDCRIAIVGEAPGATEDKFGRPFIGRAGMLLNQLLESAGILRSQCYITNVIKERPPRNDISPLIEFTANGAKGSEEYYEWERQFYNEMREVNANVVVALGNIALYATTRRHKITKERGGVIPAVDEMDNRKIIPTIHPASVLHKKKEEKSPRDKQKGGVFLYRYFIEMDLSKANRHSMSPKMDHLDRVIRVPHSIEEANKYLMQCYNLPYVGFDIEVMKGEISCFAFSKSAKDAMCIPLVKDGNHYWTPDEELIIWHGVAQILENPDVMKLGQNIIFDVSFLFDRLGIHAVNFGDTMIAQGISCPDFPKGLDFITSVYTDEPYYKDEGKKWIKFRGCSEEEFWRYNAKDAMMCSEAYPKLMLELKSLGNEETYKTQAKLIEPCMYMQARGMKVDVEGMESAAKQAEEEQANLTAELNELAGEEINPNSPKQLMNLFYVKLGLPPYLKNGKMTTDKNALKRLARKGVKEAQIVQKVRKISKLKGTYLEMKLKDGRMKSAYNPIGAADSGRLSSSKDIEDYGGNLQTLPKSIRKYVVADDGMVIYSFDLSQAENRIVAYIAPEYTLIEAFERGEDIHSKTAGLIFNKLPSEVSDEPGSCALGNGEQSERYWGKKSNHGLNYGMSYKRFALENELPEREAKLLIEAYHSAYPGIRVYHNWVRNELRENNRLLTNPFGRSRTFLEQWGEKLFDEAYNFIPQSTVADMINRWGMLYIYYRQDLFGDVDLMNQIHDSIVIQVPISIGWLDHAKIVQRIVDSMEQEVEFRGTKFRIPVEVEIGTNLGTMETITRGSNVADWASNIAEAYEQSFVSDVLHTRDDEDEEEDDE